MRSLFAFAILGFGLWTLYNTAMAAGFDPDRPDEIIGLMSDNLTLMLLVAASALAILGGLLSFVRGSLGPGLAALGAVSFGLVVITYSIAGVPVEEWKMIAVSGLVLLGLATCRGAFGRV